MSTYFRNSYLKERLPIAFNSERRVAGDPENLIIELTEPVPRVRKFEILNTSIPELFYIFNVGGNTLTIVSEFTGQPSIQAQPDMYTVDELADEITSRMREVTTTFDNYIGDLYCIYDPVTKKFILNNHYNTDTAEDILFVAPKNTFTDTSFFTFNRSTLATAIGFASLETEAIQKITTRPTTDSDKPGTEELIGNTQIFKQNYNIKAATLTMGVKVGLDTVNISLVPGVGLTGFDLADSVETELNNNASAIGETWSVFYNTHQNKFRILCSHYFRVPDDSNLGFDEDPGFDELWTLSRVAENTLVGTTQTFSITLGVDDEFVIDELTGAGDITTTIPVFTNATPDEIAVILETALNDNTLLNITYKCDFDAEIGAYDLYSVSSSAANFDRGVFDKPNFVVDNGTAFNSAITNFSSSGDRVRTRTSPISRIFPIMANIAYELDLIVVDTVTINEGNYLPADLATEITTEMNAQTSNSWTVTYNSVIKKFDIVCNDNVAFSYIYSDDYPGISEFIGFSGTISTQPGAVFSVVQSNNATLVDNKQYLYIKSSILNQNRETRPQASVAYEDHIYTSIIDGNQEDILTSSSFYENGIVIGISQTIQTLDLRLEDEDGALIDLNGGDWATNIVFVTF